MRAYITVLLIFVLVTYTNAKPDTLWVVGIEGTVVGNNQTLEIGSYVDNATEISLSDSSYICLLSTNNKFIELDSRGIYSIDSLIPLMVLYNSIPINKVAKTIINRLTRTDKQIVTGAVSAGMPPPIYQMLPRESNIRRNQEILISWKYRHERSDQEPIDTFLYVVKSIYDEPLRTLKTQKLELFLDLTDAIFDSAEIVLVHSIGKIEPDGYIDPADSFTIFLEDSVSNRISYEIDDFMRFRYSARTFLVAHYLESEKLTGEANLQWKELMETKKGEHIKKLYESYIEILNLDSY